MTPTIPAKPTRYNGINFASRLEAYWAAFFDEMRWEWEYENRYFKRANFSHYLPDFCLKPPRGGSEVIVEVKPIENFDEAAAAVMTDTVTPRHELLLVGKGPMVGDDEAVVGWLFKRNPSELVPRRNRQGDFHFAIRGGGMWGAASLGLWHDRERNPSEVIGFEHRCDPNMPVGLPATGDHWDRMTGVRGTPEASVGATVWAAWETAVRNVRASGTPAKYGRKW